MKGALRIFFSVVVLSVVAFGFYLTGSPSENRLFREDELRVHDLQSISSAVTRYVRSEKKAPTDVKEILQICEGETTYYCRSLKGINAGDYEISVTDNTSYELCTTFARAAPFPRGKARKPTYPFHHEAGRQCYSYKFPKKRRSKESILESPTVDPLISK